MPDQPDNIKTMPEPGDEKILEIPMTGSASEDPSMAPEAPEAEAPQAANQASSPGGVYAMPDKFMGGPVPPTATTVTSTADPTSGKRLFIVVGVVAVILAVITGGAYLLINSSFNPFTAGPDTSQPVVGAGDLPGDNTNDDAPIAVDEAAAKRDIQRVADVTTLAQALDAYHDEFGSYPQFLSLIPNTMLESNLTDPLTNAPYTYVVASGRQSYDLIFDVEESVDFKGETLVQGQYKMHPENFMDGDEPDESDEPDEPVVDDTTLGNLDSDADGLTAMEEAIFKTSPTRPDTDADGYNDSSEIINFYSPLQSGTIKLDQAGLVKLYENSVQKYSFFYPSTWIVSAVDSQQEEVLITSKTGEDFSVKVDKNPENLTSWEWYVKNVSGNYDKTQINLVTIDGNEAVRTLDGLNAYVAISGKAIAVEYNVNNAKTINYPSIFDMILDKLDIQ